eukprot:scaffold187105_cov31-Tisochrysis_lutea.AAC.2
MLLGCPLPLGLPALRHTSTSAALESASRCKSCAFACHTSTMPTPSHQNSGLRERTVLVGAAAQALRPLADGATTLRRGGGLST